MEVIGEVIEFLCDICGLVVCAIGCALGAVRANKQSSAYQAMRGAVSAPKAIYNQEEGSWRSSTNENSLVKSLREENSSLKNRCSDFEKRAESAENKVKEQSIEIENLHAEIATQQREYLAKSRKTAEEFKKLLQERDAEIDDLRNITLEGKDETASQLLYIRELQAENQKLRSEKSERLQQRANKQRTKNSRQLIMPN